HRSFRGFAAPASPTASGGPAVRGRGRPQKHSLCASAPLSVPPFSPAPSTRLRALAAARTAKKNKKKKGKATAPTAPVSPAPTVPTVPTEPASPFGTPSHVCPEKDALREIPCVGYLRSAL